MDDNIAVEIEIPPALVGCLERHRTNVARFVSTLRSAGMSDAQIESGVMAIVDSYRIELRRAIGALREHDHA